MAGREEQGKEEGKEGKGKERKGERGNKRSKDKTYPSFI